MRIEQEVENKRMFAVLGFLIFAQMSTIGDPWWLQQFEATGLAVGSECVVVPSTGPTPGQMAQQADRAVVRAFRLGDWSPLAFLSMPN